MALELYGYIQKLQSKICSLNQELSY